MKEQASDQAREAFLEAIDNQLRDGTPIEAREAYERLQKEGHTEQEAKRLIAAVLACEFYEMAKSKEPYDQKRYVGWLLQLPKMPYDK